MSTREQTLEKFAENQAVIGVVGLGYVGLPLSLRFSEAGYHVIGFDIDQEKPDFIHQGQSYISHIPEQRIAAALEAGLEATTDFSRASEADALIICVPTPLNPDRSPDLSFVISTTESLCPHVRKGQVISLESTTYPGTTDEELLPRMQATGLEVGKDLFLVYSPEREDPGNPDFETRTIPKIIGGHTEACLEVGMALYSQAIDQLVPVSSTRVAEMAKLLENIYRAVNIGMVNEMKIVAESMDINIYEVIAAASTKPFGFTPFYPGPGLGGHCLPIDPFYLSWKARQCGADSRFIELAGEVNTAMPARVVERARDALSARGKNLADCIVLVLGIAYKKNIDDMRESPAVAIMELLRDSGSTVQYCDPYVPTFPKMRNHQFDLASTELTVESVRQADAIIIATDHDCFDYNMLASEARLVIDSRGRFAASQADNIVQA